MKHGFTTVNVPFMPEEAKAITEDCFHLNNSISHASPPKGLLGGWRQGRQYEETVCVDSFGKHSAEGISEAFSRKPKHDS